MRGVADQEHVAEAHRLSNEAAHRRDAIFEQRRGFELCRAFLIQPVGKFLPDPVVRPFIDILIRGALEVQAAKGP